MKKQAQKGLTCHGSGSRSPDGTWQDSWCKKNMFTSEAVKFLKARVEIKFKKANCFSAVTIVENDFFCLMMPPFYKEGFILSCEFWETSLTQVEFANI